MKFNKSAESDFWYVGDEFDRHLGKIIKNEFYRSYSFAPSILISSLPEQHIEPILAKIKELNRESGIDTISTFTSLEDR